MNLSWIDWTMIVVAIVALRMVSLKTRSYMRGVSDFLVANRSAGRYLLTISGAMGNMGVISFVANFQSYGEAGFTPIWWGLMGIPSGYLITMMGWIYYRFRETRAMTLAQFLEMRYGKNFRMFSGFIIFLSGILNFGIFPAVATRFFIYFFGFPAHYHIPGLPFSFNTFATIMAIDLSLALIFVTQGGQVSVMVTECVQGIFSAFAFVVLIGLMLSHIPWSHVTTILSHAQAGHSLLNPFDSGKLPNFSVRYYLMGLFIGFFTFMSWQGAQGFQGAGRTPHEQKMGGIIGMWRNIPQTVITFLMPIFAIVVMAHPHYAGQATLVNEAIKNTHVTNPSVLSEIRGPIILAHFLPTGVKGLLAICMLFFSFTCHDTYMHSWGSIFVQDVVMPLRETMYSLTQSQYSRVIIRYCCIGAVLLAGAIKFLYPFNHFTEGGRQWWALAIVVFIGIYALLRKPKEKSLSPEQHIKLLRFSIIGVAVFAFIFSMLYKPNQMIYMFFAVTGAIWLSGAGAVLIGGLYSRYGTTAGAYGAVICGALSGLGGIFVPDWYKSHFHNIVLIQLHHPSGFVGFLNHQLHINMPAILTHMSHYPQEFPLNGQDIAFYTCLVAAVVYVVISILSGGAKKKFNLERMLHRGAYADANLPAVQKPTLYEAIVGITSDFSTGDKAWVSAMLLWNFSWFFFFVVITVANIRHPYSSEWWSHFWMIYVWSQFFISIPMTIFFAIGGTMDLKAIFAHLQSYVRDHSDNGHVERTADDFLVTTDEFAEPAIPQTEVPKAVIDMAAVVGKTCPYCQTPLKPGAQIVVCSACGMPHHHECWEQNGRCTTFGCDGKATSGPSQAVPTAPVE